MTALSKSKILGLEMIVITVNVMMLLTRKDSDTFSTKLFLVTCSPLFLNLGIAWASVRLTLRIVSAFTALFTGHRELISAAVLHNFCVFHSFLKLDPNFLGKKVFEHEQWPPHCGAIS